MPQSRSAGKPDNEAENDQLADAELQKIQCQYRVMSKDRQAYQHEAMEKVRVQKREIEFLEKEREEHLKNLSLSQSEQNRGKDEAKQDELKRLLEERDEYNEEIEELKKLEQEYENERKKKSRELKEKIRETGGASGGSDAARVRTNKQIKTLENKLDYSLKKFSNQLAENQKLRKEVEDLRKAKIRFDGVYKKLAAYDENIRVEIGRVIEQSNQAYEQREDAQNKIVIMKEKADKEEAQHQSEMRELQRSIDHEKKLREFMDIKKTEREEDEFTKQHKKKKEEEMRVKKAKEGQKDTKESYERAIAEIAEITQEEDINENLDIVVNKFIENEDRNFALFNFINDQNNRIEALQEEIDRIDRDQKEFARNEETLDRERQAKLQEIEERQALISKKCEEDEHRLKVNDKILDQLKRAIQSLFDKIDCPRGTIEELLGSSAGIKDNSMMQYLGIVEQRTNELLSIKSYLDYKDMERTGDEEQPSLLGEGPKPPPVRTEIIAPSTGDGYASDEGSDEDVKPLSVEELRQRAIRNVQKREREMNRQGTQSDMNTMDKKKKDRRK